MENIPTYLGQLVLYAFVFIILGTLALTILLSMFAGILQSIIYIYQAIEKVFRGIIYMIQSLKKITVNVRSFFLKAKPHQATPSLRQY